MPTAVEVLMNPIDGFVAMIGHAFHRMTARLYKFIGTKKMVTTNVNCGSSFLKSDLSGEICLDTVEII